MMNKIKALFAPKASQKNDFSEFFYNASAAEKKKLMLKVIKEANQDQKDLIERYDKIFTKTT